MSAPKQRGSSGGPARRAAAKRARALAQARARRLFAAKVIVLSTVVGLALSATIADIFSAPNVNAFHCCNDALLDIGGTRGDPARPPLAAFRAQTSTNESFSPGNEFDFEIPGELAGEDWTLTLTGDAVLEGAFVDHKPATASSLTYDQDGVPSQQFSGTFPTHPQLSPATDSFDIDCSYLADGKDDYFDLSIFGKPSSEFLENRWPWRSYQMPDVAVLFKTGSDIADWLTSDQPSCFVYPTQTSYNLVQSFPDQNSQASSRFTWVTREAPVAVFRKRYADALANGLIILVGIVFAFLTGYIPVYLDARTQQRS